MSIDINKHYSEYPINFDSGKSTVSLDINKHDSLNTLIRTLQIQ
jgi:hypothetical protein